MLFGWNFLNYLAKIEASTPLPHKQRLCPNSCTTEHTFYELWSMDLLWHSFWNANCAEIKL